MNFKKFFSNFQMRHLPVYQYFYFVLLIIFLPFLRFTYDNDFWFSINQGRYFLNNGLTNIAINSIHNIECIYQSWGSCTIFYIIYHYFGDYGMIVFQLLIGLLTAYFLYKLCLTVSNKKRLSIIITLIIMTFYDLYFVTRPHIFTVLNLVICLYLLESYLKTNNKKYLYFLPLISLLQVNMHGIYFIVLLILLSPYIINSFKFNLFGIFKSDGYSKKSLFITFFVMFLTGFINPYGYKTIIYGFNSYFSGGILNDTITELRALNFHEELGRIFIIIIIITYIIYFYNHKNVLLRYYLLLFGTSYLALDAVKSIYIFLFCSIFPIAYIFKDKKSRIIDIPYSKFYRGFHFTLTMICLVYIVFNFQIPPKPDIKKYVDYLDEHVENKETTKIYTCLKDGSYLEYNGYYSYIDPRAEIFIKANNHKEDIYEEYDKVLKLKIDYRDFIDKYQFDYMIINNKDTLYYLMPMHDYYGYEIVLSDTESMLLKLKENKR